LLKVVHIKYKLGRGGAIQLPVSLNPIFPFDSGFLLYYCMAVVNWYLAQKCRISTTSVCVCFLCLSHKIPNHHVHRVCTQQDKEYLLFHG